MNWIKQYWGSIVTIIAILAIGVCNYLYYRWYIPHEDYKKGFVIVDTFNCPDDHPIKAHLGSMIYHIPDGDPYYAETNAANGYCFDTCSHAASQGFRPPTNYPLCMDGLGRTY